MVIKDPHLKSRESIYTIDFSLSLEIKGAGGLADLKISKSALLFLNHNNFSNTESIYTE